MGVVIFGLYRFFFNKKVQYRDIEKRRNFNLMIYKLFYLFVDGNVDCVEKYLLINVMVVYSDKEDNDKY